MVIIFGKDSCPYTLAAREEYAPRGADLEYVDVTKDAAGMQRMLVYSKGKRRVPVIVDGEQVQIGFGGT